jgi:thioredoxin-like negative regulator of GroEL
MSAGIWMLVGIGLGFAVLMGFQAALARQTRAAIGREVPASSPLAAAEGRLVWFHAPTCAPCRAMHRDVLALGDRVLEVDVSQRPDLAAAFGVMATPTTLRVQGGKVVAARAGRIGREQLEAMLDAG